MKELNHVILLSCVSVLSVTGQFNVIGSNKTVRVTVGHDVILPCHLEPPYDVTNRTVEWKRDKDIVHVYRSMKDYLDNQDENFRGRTFLFHDEQVKGNISLKLTNVTEQDEGNYTCYVTKQDSRGFIQLRVDPEENRNKEDQTDSDKKAEESNNNNIYWHIGFIVLGIIAAILVIVAIVVIIIWTRRVKNNPHGGPDGGRPQEGYKLDPMDEPHVGQDVVEAQEEDELVLRDANIQPGQDGVEPQEEDEEALMEDPRAGQDGGEPQEEHEEAAIVGNIQPGRRGKYKPALRTGDIQTYSHVRHRRQMISN